MRVLGFIGHHSMPHSSPHDQHLTGTHESSKAALELSEHIPGPAQNLQGAPVF